MNVLLGPPIVTVRQERVCVVRMTGAFINRHQCETLRAHMASGSAAESLMAYHLKSRNGVGKNTEEKAAASETVRMKWGFEADAIQKNQELINDRYDQTLCIESFLATWKDLKTTRESMPHNTNTLGTANQTVLGQAT